MEIAGYNRFSLGYKWNENMSFEDFFKENDLKDWEKAYRIYNLIEERYLFDKYERTNENREARN